MTGAISGGGNIFATEALAPISTHTDAQLYAANGITDVNLLNQWNAQTTLEAQVNFLNKLTPEQLSEKTIGGFQAGGARIATYATLKAFTSLQLELTQRSNELQGGGSADLSRSEATSANVEQGYIGTLFYQLNNNIPGAAENIKAYIASVQSQDVVSLSKQGVIAAQQAFASYNGVDRYGNWGPSAGSSAALSALEATLRQENNFTQPVPHSSASSQRDGIPKANGATRGGADVALLVLTKSTESDRSNEKSGAFSQETAANATA